MIAEWEKARIKPRTFTNRELIEKVECSGDSIRNVFKTGSVTSNAWKNLIVPTSEKGRYALRLSPSDSVG